MLRGPMSVLFIPLVFSMIAWTSPVLGDPVLKEQVIKQWGFSLKVVEDWKSMPQEPGEKFVVGGWKCDWQKSLSLRGDESGINAELQIVRVPVTEAATVGKEKTDDEKAKEAEDKKKIERVVGGNWEKKTSPKSMEDYLEGNWEGASKRWMEKPVTAGKLKGRLLEFSAGTSAYAVGIFRDNNIDWGVIYQANEENYKKKWQATYLKSIQSFKLFASEGAQPTIAAATDLRKLKGDEKRKAVKAGIAGSPGWWSMDTKNYVFLSNSTSKDMVKQLASEIETIREKVYIKLFPPRQALDQICVVRVLGTESDYYAYGGPRGSAGYWNHRAEELVLFENFEGVSKKNSKDFTKSVMYHEAFHQYIYYAVGNVSPHSWFNEGHGDYFAGMHVAGASVTFSMFDWRTKYLREHLTQKKDLIPIKSLVRYPQSEYYSNGGLKYSQGWALVYYLRQVAKDKRIREIPDIYFKYLADNVTSFRAKKKEEDADKPSSGGIDIEGIPGIEIPDFEDMQAVEKILSEAVDKAFEGVDFEKLDRDFRSWLDSAL